MHAGMSTEFFEVPAPEWINYPIGLAYFGVLTLLNKKSTRHTAAGCRRRGSRAIKDRQREVLGKRDAGTPYFQ